MTKAVYCTAPWNGLTIRENGIVRTCCNGISPLGDLKRESIETVEKSAVLTDIKQTLLQNKPHPNCQSCVDAERTSGFSSLRHHYNTFYPTINADIELKFIDIRWNNTCNLNCLYCGPQLSSTWADRLQIRSDRPVKPYQDELLDWILTKIDTVEEIMLVGGEPMLMKQNHVLFSKLPQNTKISIITNLSYDIEKLPCISDLLARPKDRIMWNISAENTHDKYEYIRSGAEWSQVERNLKFLVQHWPDTVSMDMVYCLFSAFDLPDTITKLSALGIKKILLSPVQGQKEITLGNMPREIKQQAKQLLIAAETLHKKSIRPRQDIELYPLVGVNDIIANLDTDTESVVSLDEFDSKIAWYDQWGPKKFNSLWPELADTVRKHLV